MGSPAAASLQFPPSTPQIALPLSLSPWGYACFLLLFSTYAPKHQDNGRTWGIANLTVHRYRSGQDKEKSVLLLSI